MNQLCCSQDMCGRPERSPCCEGEYIIERVIGKNRQKCCYQGILPIENSGTFCPPLFLKEIEAIDIATICPAQPCSCGTQQLRLTLLLRSIDGRGCRFQSYAEVQIEVCEGTNRPTVCKTNVRRGATVCIRRAQFCPPSGFDVELLIDVETIISRVEIIGQERRCQSVCPTLPLYPPVPCCGKKNEHLWE